MCIPHVCGNFFFLDDLLKKYSAPFSGFFFGEGEGGGGGGLWLSRMAWLGELHWHFYYWHSWCNQSLMQTLMQLLTGEAHPHAVLLEAGLINQWISTYSTADSSCMCTATLL